MATSTLSYTGSTLSMSHPRVVSLVSNAEETYQANIGGLRTFAAIVCERGVEDIQIISSANDLISLTGEPNIRKYGQQSYNLIKWLNAGGEAAVLRVLPDDAGFAHSFLNVQTKINSNTKKIGDLTLNVNDVTLRTVLSATSNNTNETILQYELTKKRDNTIDGFAQHLIMLIKPTGRGEYYNNLGVRLTSNKQFDSNSKSRMYNFEVVEYNDDNNVISIKEGPYRVSFDEDALSTTSRESLYIEDVINTYSKYIRVKVNHDAILEVANIINPEVYPYSIDMLFGEDRYINGALETFEYDSDTKLPVQIALHSYNAAGMAIYDENGEIKKNIIDGSDELQGYTIDMDNSYNSSLRDNYLKSVAAMKQAANVVKKGTFSTVADTKINALNAKHVGAEPAYTDEISLTSTLGEMRNTLDFLRSVKTDLVDLEILDKIAKVEKGLSEYKGVRSKTTTISLMVSNLKSDFNSALASNINSDILTQASIVLNETENMYKSLMESSTNALSSLDEFTGSGESWIGNTGLIEDQLSIISTAKMTLESKYKVAIDEFEEDSAIASALEVIKGSDEEDSIVLTLLDNVRNAAVALGNAVRGKFYSTDLYQVVGEIIDEIVKLKDSKVTASNEDSALSNIKTTIDNLQNYKGDMIPLTQHVLQSMANPGRLRMGTDGSVSMDNPNRDAVIKGLLMSAYSGIINEKIINKKLLPFNFIMDAGYDLDIKNVISNLASDVRKDFVFIADCGFDRPTVQSVLEFRRLYNVSSNYTAIYGQEVTAFDQFTNRDQKFTMPYLLSNKFPTLYNTVGLHYPIAGNKRGVLEGYKSISFTPNDSEQEELYTNRVNYAVSDTKRTKLMSQLTSDYSKTPLSDLNNVITMLSIKRDAEGIMEGYQFEFADNDTMRAMNADLKSNLNKYIVGNAVENITVEVYASDYDLTQHVVRANIGISFKDIVETVIITLEVTK